MASVPSSTPSPDPTINNPFTVERYHAVLSVIIVAFVITTFALSLRLYVRVKITRSLWFDDALLVTSHAFNTVACGVYMNVRRQAPHVVPDSQESYRLFSLPKLVTLSFYIVASFLAKAAIAMWFWNIVRVLPRKRLMHIIISIALAIYFCICFITCFTVLFRCGVPPDPIRIINAADNCSISPSVMQYVTNTVSVVNSVCDWTFALAPLYILYKSPMMRRGARIAASMVIGLAIVGSIISIARLPFLNRGAQFGPHWLSNYDLSIAYVLSLLETAVAITAVSLATLQPLVSVVRRKWSQFKDSTSGTERTGARSARSAGQQGAPVALPAPHFPGGLPLSWDSKRATSMSTTNKTLDMNASVLGALGNIGVLGTLLMTVNEDEVPRDPGAVGVVAVAELPAEDARRGDAQAETADVEAQRGVRRSWF